MAPARGAIQRSRPVSGEAAASGQRSRSKIQARRRTTSPRETAIVANLDREGGEAAEGRREGRRRDVRQGDVREGGEAHDEDGGSEERG